jgi:hypothetical protein
MSLFPSDLVRLVVNSVHPPSEAVKIIAVSFERRSNAINQPVYILGVHNALPVVENVAVKRYSRDCELTLPCCFRQIIHCAALSAAMSELK